MKNVTIKNRVALTAEVDSVVNVTDEQYELIKEYCTVNEVKKTNSRSTKQNAKKDSDK